MLTALGWFPLPRLLSSGVDGVQDGVARLRCGLSECCCGGEACGSDLTLGTGLHLTGRGEGTVVEEGEKGEDEKEGEEEVEEGEEEKEAEAILPDWWTRAAVVAAVTVVDVGLECWCSSSETRKATRPSLCGSVSGVLLCEKMTSSTSSSSCSGKLPSSSLSYRSRSSNSSPEDTSGE
jgi:hypothetical protein